MSWRDTLRGSAPLEQSEESEVFPLENRIVHITQIPQGCGNPAFPPGPATEADYQRVADRHWNRAARLTPDETGERIAEVWPGLHRQLVEADAEITRLWLSCSRGERQYPKTFPAFKAAFRAWARLHLQGARYVRLLDKGIRRAYSRKLTAWIYIVQSKAAVRGVRLRPRGAVYTVEECRALLTVNPGLEELRAVHKVRVAFQGEIFA